MYTSSFHFRRYIYNHSGNLKSGRLVKRVCKTARRTIHSRHPVGANNSKMNPVVSAIIWGKSFFQLLFIHENFGLIFQKSTKTGIYPTSSLKNCSRTLEILTFSILYIESPSVVSKKIYRQMSPCISR